MFRTLSLFLLLTSASFAAPIEVVSVTGSTTQTEWLRGPDLFASYLAIDWITGSSGYSNVTITALLSGHSDDLLAYLSTTIGPGTSLFVTSAHITLDTDTLTETTLFTGLTLDPNTHYYLTLAPDADGEYRWASDSATITTDTGVVFGGARSCNADVGNCAEPPPSSPGFADSDWDLSNPLYFTVIAQDSPVGSPEPSTIWMAVGGAALALYARRRRKA